MILILKMEDGSTRPLRPDHTVSFIVGLLRMNDVETIVAGEIEGDKVLWEKQFNAVDVMPTEFSQKGK